MSGTGSSGTGAAPPRAAVIGTGPAGEAAGRALLDAGAGVTWVDEQPRTGGNIGRVAVAAATTPLEAVAAGAGGAELLTDTAVLAVAPDGQVTLDDGSGPRTRTFDAVILACGAYDLHHPLPGCPDPRVTSAGSLQALLKGQGLRPAGRVIVAGAGPFVHVAAAGLAAAGARVTHVVDRLTRADELRLAPWGLAMPANALELVATRRRLRAHGTRIVAGRSMTAMTATGAELDDGTTLACDHLGLTELFAPQTQLARTAGCRQRYSRAGGYWVTDTDARGRTSVAGIYVCGEGQGVRGWRHAAVSGRLAAASVARDLGLRPASGRIGDRLRRRVFAHFGEALERAQRRREPLRPRADAVVCPCEGATVGQVNAAIELGLDDLSSIKVTTRCGMGPCQGRYCEPLVSRLVEHAGRTPRAPLRQRAFTRPATAGAIVAGTADDA